MIGVEAEMGNLLCLGHELFYKSLRGRWTDLLRKPPTADIL